MDSHTVVRWLIHCIKHQLDKQLPSAFNHTPRKIFNYSLKLIHSCSRRFIFKNRARGTIFKDLPFGHGEVSLWWATVCRPHGLSVPGTCGCGPVTGSWPAIFPTIKWVWPHCNKNTGIGDPGGIKVFSRINKYIAYLILFTHTAGQLRWHVFVHILSS